MQPKVKPKGSKGQCPRPAFISNRAPYMKKNVPPKIKNVKNVKNARKIKKRKKREKNKKT